MEKKYTLSLEDVLGRDDQELTALKQDDFYVEKLKADVPFTAIDHPEYKQAKKDCMKMVPTGDGGMTPDLDDDKLMVKVIIAAVDKDKRSNFTFANKDLLKKLGVATAEAAVGKLLSPGEVYRMAMKVQNLSGFGTVAKKEQEAEVKNS